MSQLANVHEILFINSPFEDEKLTSIFQYYSTDPEEMEKELHLYAAELPDDGEVDAAGQVLLELN